MFKTTQENFKVIQKFALYGGIVAFYLVAIGIVEVFSPRNLVGTFLSLGHVFLFLGPLGVGILVARELKEKEVNSIYLAGFITGLMSSVSLIIFNLIVEIFVINANEDAIFHLRDMFVNFSESGQEFLTFGLGMFAGNIVLALLFGLEKIEMNSSNIQSSGISRENSSIIGITISGLSQFSIPTPILQRLTPISR